MQKEKPLFKIPEATAYTPDVHPYTLGHWAIQGDMKALGHELQADAISAQLEWRGKVADWQDPRQIGLGRTVMAHLGFSESEKLLSYRAARHRSAIEQQLSPEDIEQQRQKAHDQRILVRQELDMVRERLLEIPSNKQRNANAAAHRSLSAFQLAQFQERQRQEPSLTVITWLTESLSASMPDHTEAQRARKDAQRLEDDQRLLNFLQRHSQRLEQRQQHPQFIQEVKREKEKWREGTLRGVAERWLHPLAGHQIPRLKHVKVHEGDYFSTKLERTGGYFDPNNPNRVVVTRESVQHATCHELNHALLQVDPKKEHSVLGQPWFYEPLTEEIHLAQQGYDFGAFQPEIGTYKEERKLIYTILETAQAVGADVDLGDLTYMYSAPSQLQPKLLAAFERKIHAAGFPKKHILTYVHDTYQTIANRIEYHPKESHLDYYAKQALAARRATASLQKMTRERKKSAGGVSSTMGQR